MGQEYADRRAIVSTLKDQESNRAKLQRVINESRGTAAGNWRVQIAKERVRILNDAIGASLQIAGNDLGDWSFKRAMIKDVIDYSRAISPDQ